MSDIDPVVNNVIQLLLGWVSGRSGGHFPAFGGHDAGHGTGERVVPEDLLAKVDLVTRRLSDQLGEMRYILANLDIVRRVVHNSAGWIGQKRAIGLLVPRTTQVLVVQVHCPAMGNPAGESAEH